MMAITHAAIAACTVSVTLGSASPLVLGVAAIASQLPDIDTTKSYTGRALYPIAAWIESRYAHRSVSHSFLASGLIAIATAPLLFFFNWQWWGAINIGFFMGWFADCFTKNGVAAFYPNGVRLVIPGNPNNRLKSGGSGELGLLAIATAILIISCNLVSNGGVTEIFARSFFHDASTAGDMFHKYGSNQQIFIHVEGIHNLTNQTVNEDYKVIAAIAATSVIAKDSKDVLYQIGTDASSQIKPVNLKTRLGSPITITSTDKAIGEIMAEDWLKSVSDNAFLTGSLIVDDAKDIKTPNDLEKYPVATIAGNQVELKNARKRDVAKMLEDQYILNGKVIIKVRSDE
jgi:inner membrane protein